MKKLDIEKKNVSLNQNLNKKKVQLDSKKADSHKKNILKQLEVISKSLDEMESILNKMAMKKVFSNEHNALALQCARKCASQAQAARSLIANFEAKYSDDQKTVLIRDLDERISYLEERLANME